MNEKDAGGHARGMQAVEALAASGPTVLAFDALYEEYADAVARTLRRLGVPAEQVEDATQETFLVIHRKLGGFEGRSSTRTWVYGIVLRVAKDVRRRQRRKPAGAPLSEALVADEPSPLDAAARGEQLRLLDAALDALDERKRAVFVMAEIEQLTANEIAQVLGENVNTIYSRIRQARLAVEAAIGPRSPS